MRRWWLGERKQIDERRGEARATARKIMRGLLNNGDEQGFVAYVRLLKTGVTDEELQNLLRLFRDEHQALRRNA
jgi:hypothetical protein